MISWRHRRPSQGLAVFECRREIASAAKHDEFGNDLRHGANIAGFLKVARSMLAQGI
ncbi:MAG: hypothetical protein OSA40_05305 [Phycisphaerales bacterium]|nr:hypothetical protein [Phycisphaerales bacterium]